MRLKLILLVVCVASVAVYAQSVTSEEQEQSNEAFFLPDQDAIIELGVSRGSRPAISSRPSTSASRPSTSASRPSSSTSKPSTSPSRPNFPTSSSTSTSKLNTPSNSNSISKWLSNTFGKPNSKPSTTTNPAPKPTVKPVPKPAVNPNPQNNPAPGAPSKDPKDPKNKKPDSNKPNPNNGGGSPPSSGGGGPSGGGSGGGMQLPIPDLSSLGGLFSGGSDPNRGTVPYSGSDSPNRGNSYDSTNPNFDNSGPNPDTSSSTFPYFSQLDSRWSNEPIGKSTLTIGNNGSITTCLAMLFGGFNIKIRGQTPNPSILNQQLSLSEGYGAKGEINWSVVKRLGFDSLGPFNSFEDVSKSMTSGNFCILNVKSHWVLAVGISGDYYNVMDPKDQFKTTYHSSEASAARCFVRK